MATKRKAHTNNGLKDSAYEIWLAGLGAFNMAGEEGSKLFKQLVEKGAEQEEANKEWMADMTERIQVLKGDAKHALSKVTSPIEDGLAAAMQRLGVPTRAEIIKLTHRVEELTKIVTQSRAAGHAKPKPRTRTARA
jgi:poly(hydroxyalkanoate) granule-associated protein